jgi:hypothetical protein
VKPFRNKGWPHYDEMSPLMPTIAKGFNVFRAPGPLTMKDPNIDPALYEEDECLQKQQNSTSQRFIPTTENIQELQIKTATCQAVL